MLCCFHVYAPHNSDRKLQMERLLKRTQAEMDQMIIVTQEYKTLQRALQKYKKSVTKYT